MTAKYNLYSILKREIISGKIKSGTPLVERNLARRFKLSRTPIRDAITMLERDGLIVNQRRHGYQVRIFPMVELLELSTIVAALEGIAAVIAVPRVNSKAIKKMKEINNRLKSRQVQQDSSSYLRISKEFHRVFVKESGNKALARIIDDVRGPLEKYRIFTFFVEDIQKTIREHNQILKAFEQKKSERVRALVEKHISSKWELVINLLRKT